VLKKQNVDTFQPLRQSGRSREAGKGKKIHPAKKLDHVRKLGEALLDLINF
jgi:hypothetical protein